MLCTLAPAFLFQFTASQSEIREAHTAKGASHLLACQHVCAHFTLRYLFVAGFKVIPSLWYARNQPLWRLRIGPPQSHPGTH